MLKRLGSANWRLTALVNVMWLPSHAEARGSLAATIYCRHPEWAYSAGGPARSRGPSTILLHGRTTARTAGCALAIRAYGCILSCGSKRPCSRRAANKAGRACHKSLLGDTMQRCHQLRAAFQEVVPCQRPGGRANSAKARAASQTPERRREVARKAVAARWAK